MTEPVCSRCNDTHVMVADVDSARSGRWPCTMCPIPCSLCKLGGYCKDTPCACACHVKRKLVPHVSISSEAYALLMAKARVCDAFRRMNTGETVFTLQKELSRALDDLETTEARNG